MGTDFVGDFVGAFTTVCEMVIDVVSVTDCGALAFGGTFRALRLGNIAPILATLEVDIGDVKVVFGFGLDVLPALLPVLLFFGAGSP